jgi:hypothetical protein
MDTKNTEHEGPNWLPLESAVLAAGLPLETCSEYMWMYRADGWEHYKHRNSRRYLTLPSTDLAELSTPGHLRTLLRETRVRP